MWVCLGNEAADELAGRQWRSGEHLGLRVEFYKGFFNCPCTLLASPAHLLDCWGISLRQLFEEQGLVCETITRKGQMDLVKTFLLQGDWKQQQQYNLELNRNIENPT
ncbi:uncharacterized protein TNCV_1305691 [Trichonephila clavipes]|nr:uncharacterized protein TNCV_1305691 [Trichonephila clavipes]